MNREIIIFPWLEENYPQKIKKIVKNARSKDIIIFNPEEHSVLHDLRDFVPNLLDSLHKNKSRIIVWQGNHYEQLHPLERSPYIKIYNWPTFLVHYTYTLGKKLHPFDYKNVDRMFISMNNTAHEFRCKFIDSLAEHDLIENNYISWRNVLVNDYPFKFYDGKTRLIGNEKEEFFPFDYPEEYYKSFFSVISESCVDRLDISEKVYVPMYTKKPFIAVGARNYYKKLQELGFELYDEIFNYRFDKYKLYEERLEDITLQLKQLQHKSFSEMYEKIKDKLEHNHNNFLKLKDNKKLIPIRFKSLYYRFSHYDYFKRPYIANIVEKF